MSHYCPTLYAVYVAVLPHTTYHVCGYTTTHWVCSNVAYCVCGINTPHCILWVWQYCLTLYWYHTVNMAILPHTAYYVYDYYCLAMRTIHASTAPHYVCQTDSTYQVVGSIYTFRILMLLLLLLTTCCRMKITFFYFSTLIPGRRELDNLLIIKDKILKCVCKEHYFLVRHSLRQNLINSFQSLFHYSLNIQLT